MNEHAIPVLIAFFTVAGIAALLLYRAFKTLESQRLGDDVGSVQMPAPKHDVRRAEARAES